MIATMACRHEHAELLELTEKLEAADHDEGPIAPRAASMRHTRSRAQRRFHEHERFRADESDASRRRSRRSREHRAMAKAVSLVLAIDAGASGTRSRPRATLPRRARWEAAAGERHEIGQQREGEDQIKQEDNAMNGLNSRPKRGETGSVSLNGSRRSSGGMPEFRRPLVKLCQLMITCG